MSILTRSRIPCPQNIDPGIIEDTFLEIRTKIRHKINNLSRIVHRNFYTKNNTSSTYHILEREMFLHRTVQNNHAHSKICLGYKKCNLMNLLNNSCMAICTENKILYYLLSRRTLQIYKICMICLPNSDVINRDSF
jgi:hypothetical protein